MPISFYLYENKRSAGPFTSEELEVQYRASKIDGDTFCCPATLSTALFGSSYKPLREFFPHFRSASTDKQQAEQGQREHARRQQRQGEREQAKAVAFDCVECGRGLRLHLQQSHNLYRCPSCKTEYKVVQSNGESPVLLVLPLSRHRTQSADRSAKRAKTVSPEVRAALNELALDEDATIDRVHRAYREVVKQYHPDMVAHLGPELRKVAEMKTKEINSAYQILERFYAG
jgi:DNA-directed RNA polymerase subunit RPC12/RpoP